MIEKLVSIIMPSYNSEKYIAESIKSVISQTYKKWELLVIDDCSKDGTVEIVEKYCKKYNNIKLLKLNKNSGAAIARNKGIGEAQGEFIAFLDSDDLWKKEKLEEQLSYMIENNCSFSFSEYEEIDEKGQKIGVLIKVPSVPVSYRRYLLTNPIGCLTVLYDVKKIGKVMFPLAEKREDAALWLKILREKKILAVPIQKSLAYYRIRKFSVSRNKIRLLKYQWNLYKNIEKLSFIESIFYLITIILTKLFKLKEKTSKQIKHNN